MTAGQACGQRVVVLGGTGFLGRHLLDALRKHPATRDAELFVAARNVPGGEFAVRFVAGDRDDPGFVAGLMRDVRPDLWFDLALFDPDAADALAVAASATRSARCLCVAGSIAEDFSDSAYGRGKAAAWAALRAAHRRHALPVFWAVLPQLWGPHDPHGRDCLFVRGLLERAPIILRGNGRTLLPDGFAPTVAQAMVHAALHPAAAGVRSPLAGLCPLTPLAFIRRAADALGIPPDIRHLDPGDAAGHERKSGQRFRPVFGDHDVRLDLTWLAASGFRPAANARAGVEQTARWHAQNRSVPDPSFDMSAFAAAAAETQPAK